MTTERRAALLPILAIAVAMISVQFGATAAHRLFATLGPAGATALRVGLGAVMVNLILQPWRAKLTRKMIPILLIYGVTLGLMNLTFYWSLSLTPQGVAVALEFVGPLAVAIGSSRRWIDFAWIGLAVVGLIFLLPFGHASAQVNPLGAILALVAGGFWAIYILAGRRAGQAAGRHATAFGMIVATAVVLPVGLVHSGLGLFAPAILPTALAVAVLSSVVPYTLEMFALMRTPPQVFGTLMSMEPAIGAVLGLVLLREHLTLTQWLAIIAVMGAAFGVAITAPPTPSIEELG
jgi:inner membrane transporter RhtA